MRNKKNLGKVIAQVGHLRIRQINTIVPLKDEHNNTVTYNKGRLIKTKITNTRIAIFQGKKEISSGNLKTKERAIKEAEKLLL